MGLPPTAARRQVRELSLVGCHSLSRGLAQLPNLVLLDLQPLHLMLDEEEGGWVWGQGAGGGWRQGWGGAAIPIMQRKRTGMPP